MGVWGYNRGIIGVVRVGVYGGIIGVSHVFDISKCKKNGLGWSRIGLG